MVVGRGTCRFGFRFAYMLFEEVFWTGGSVEDERRCARLKDSAIGTYSYLRSQTVRQAKKGADRDTISAGFTDLGKIDAKSVHVQPVEKSGKILAEPGQTLMHEL